MRFNSQYTNAFIYLQYKTIQLVVIFLIFFLVLFYGFNHGAGSFNQLFFQSHVISAVCATSTNLQSSFQVTWIRQFPRPQHSIPKDYPTNKRISLPILIRFRYKNPRWKATNYPLLTTSRSMRINKLPLNRSNFGTLVSNSPYSFRIFINFDLFVTGQQRAERGRSRAYDEKDFKGIGSMVIKISKFQVFFFRKLPRLNSTRLLHSHSAASHQFSTQAPRKSCGHPF
jgi:hypothetical protein